MHISGVCPRPPTVVSRDGSDDVSDIPLLPYPINIVTAVTIVTKTGKPFYLRLAYFIFEKEDRF